ncbi:hypothetical protein PC116_g6425 [Phytophthora cactorum]|nr:hypothetical protein Pcac1_g19176 [Phytophthora cactorum]KAG4245767.1 hypothetical protein PC116_g6425 [Phytophthora cactorum]
MARWLSFFAEYNFEVKYKPGRLNVVADALSRRSDYELAHVTAVTSSVFDLIRAAYAHDDMCVALLRALGSEEFKNSDKELSRRLRSMAGCCTTAPTPRTRLVWSFLMMRISSIESSMRSMIRLSVDT